MKQMERITAIKRALAAIEQNDRAQLALVRGEISRLQDSLVASQSLRRARSDDLAARAENPGSEGPDLSLALGNDLRWLQGLAEEDAKTLHHKSVLEDLARARQKALQTSFGRAQAFDSVIKQRLLAERALRERRKLV